jgi:hypothetical protein
MRVMPALIIRITRFGTSTASAYKLMKSGASYIPSKRTFQRRSAVSLAMAMFGHGRRLMRTQSCWYLGRRDAEAAYTFMSDMADRLTNRIQLTTDGHHAYLTAVDAAFDRQIDYAMLVKKYGTAPEAEKRYSPPICLGADKTEIRGLPDPQHISTSYVEKQNLSMRMGMRRFTRLTNAFSKKLENHMHALSIYFMHYNFVRIHQTLRCTPAMEAGVTDHLWDLNDVVAIVNEWEASQKVENSN